METRSKPIGLVKRMTYGNDNNIEGCVQCELNRTDDENNNGIDIHIPSVCRYIPQSWLSFVKLQRSTSVPATVDEEEGL